MAEKVQGQEALTESVLNEAKTVTDLRAEIRAEVEVAASAHKGRFWFLFLLFIALAGVGYNRYRKIMKSHLRSVDSESGAGFSDTRSRL